MKKIVSVVSLVVILFMFSSCGFRNYLRDSLKASLREDYFKESQSVVINDVEFHIPTYFNMVAEESTDTYKMFCSESEDGSSILTVEVIKTNYVNQEAFDEEKWELLSENVDKFGGEEFEVTKEEEIVIASFPGAIRTILKSSEGVVDGTVSRSVAYDSKRERVIFVSFFLASEDYSDYLRDYEEILESAEFLLKTEMDNDIINKDKEGLIDGMRPEFVEAMNNYEEFYDKYCEFMKTYSNNTSDFELLTEYYSLLIELEEMDRAFEAWEDEELNNIEQKYYLEVTNRITKKLLEISQ